MKRRKPKDVFQPSVFLFISPSQSSSLCISRTGGMLYVWSMTDCLLLHSRCPRGGSLWCQYLHPWAVWWSMSNQSSWTGPQADGQTICRIWTIHPWLWPHAPLTVYGCQTYSIWCPCCPEAQSAKLSCPWCPTGISLYFSSNPKSDSPCCSVSLSDFEPHSHTIWASDRPSRLFSSWSM